MPVPLSRYMGTRLADLPGHPQSVGAVRAEFSNSVRDTVTAPGKFAPRPTRPVGSAKFQRHRTNSLTFRLLYGNPRSRLSFWSAVPRHRFGRVGSPARHSQGHALLFACLGRPPRLAAQSDVEPPHSMSTSHGGRIAVSAEIVNFSPRTAVVRPLVTECRGSSTSIYNRTTTMGLETFAISKAKWVASSSDEEDDDGDCPFYVGHRRDGKRPGIYVVGKGGRYFNGWDGSYSAYNAWREQLSFLALGVTPETVWTDPRRFRHKPFVELIDFPDGGNCEIGPQTSAKLYQDFVTFAAKAKKHFIERSPDITPPARAADHRKNPQKHWNRQAGLVFTTQLNRLTGGTTVAAPPEDRRWMLDVYRSFRGAFRTASDGGFVFFW